MVVQGTYGQFGYNSSQGKDITLLGGYTANCASRVVDPSNTILDSGNSGRVLYLYDSNAANIAVDGFTIQNGSVTGSGGGCSAYSYSGSGTAGTISFTNNIIVRNSATDAGAGIYVNSQSNSGTGGSVIIRGNTIMENHTGYSGGGVYASSISTSGNSGNITIQGNTFTENNANEGGGIYAWSISTLGIGGMVTLNNNVITGNNASRNSGGASVASYSNSGTSGMVSLANNLITGNNAVADRGGGVYAASYTSSGTAGTVTMTSNTITGNNANQGGGTYLQASGSFGGYVNCYNNIIWNNTAPSGGDIYLYLYGTGGSMGYNNDYGVMGGANWNNQGNNINLDPLFIGSDNYHLQPSSPCIDAGNNSAPGLPSSDFEMDGRVVDGDSDGTPVVDMGADEYTGLVTPLNQTICVGCTLINKYQPPFQWMADGVFKSFTILFSTSPTDFLTEGVFVAKTNVSGKYTRYAPSAGTWKKVMTASDNNGNVRDIFWKVTGTKSDKTTWESAARYLRMDEPQAAVIQSPSDGAEFPPEGLPTFVFETNCNVKFQLEVSSLSDNFADPKQVQRITMKAANPNETTLLQKTLSSGQWNAVKKRVGAGGTGYFRIRAWDRINRETVSELRSFTVP